MIRPTLGLRLGIRGVRALPPHRCAPGRLGGWPPGCTATASLCRPGRDRAERIPAAVSASVSESSSRVSRVSTAVRRPTAVRTAVSACPTLISSLPVCDHARNDYTDVLRYLTAAERIHGRPRLPHSGGCGRRRVRRNERRDHPTPARYLAEEARADLHWVNRFGCRAVHWLGLVLAARSTRACLKTEWTHVCGPPVVLWSDPIALWARAGMLHPSLSSDTERKRMRT